MGTEKPMKGFVLNLPSHTHRTNTKGMAKPTGRESTAQYKKNILFEPWSSKAWSKLQPSGEEKGCSECPP
jgi:hypothetical protein